MHFKDCLIRQNIRHINLKFNPGQFFDPPAKAGLAQRWHPQLRPGPEPRSIPIADRYLFVNI